MSQLSCFFLFFLLGLLATPLALATPSSTDAASPALPQSTTTDWWHAVQQDLQAQEYHASENENGLQAPNRRHNFRTYFEPNGIRVVERQGTGSHALLRLRLTALGRGTRVKKIPAGTVRSGGNRVELHRSGLVEWYENTAGGLEQGFTLARRPAGSGPLVLRLAVDGATVRQAGEEVELLTASGRRLRYGKLVTRDATGREISGQIAVKASDIHLIIADSGARYPLIIDPLLTGVADARLEEGQAGALLGMSVAGAGDVNGDGFDDVIVGAPFYDNGQSNEGTAFVYHGRASGININADVRLESNQAEAQLGASVAEAGDVDNDGFSDVIIGAPFYDNGQTNEGTAFVYLGGVGGISVGADVRLESNQAEAQLGASVAEAGDVDNDGFSDVIVGAPFYDNGQTNEGAAFVYLGGSGGVGASADVQLESNQAEAQLGASVAGAGDVDNDGFSDVIVGAPLFDNGSTNEGGAFIHLGSAGGVETSADTRLDSDQAEARLGASVAGAGDVNNDGFADVIIGAPLFNSGSMDEGAAFVYHGTATGVGTIEDAQLEGNQSAAELGTSVAGAGDVNNDGFADVIVGAPLFNSGSTDEGVAFVYRGSTVGVGITAVARLEGNQNAAELGTSVAGAGDVNNDGFADVIVGAPLFESTDEGTAFVYHGGPTASFSINNVTLAEGNSGTTAFVFTVTLAAPSATTVTVNYATANGTATAGSDYTATSGTLTFAPGQTSRTLTVNVTGNTIVELTETFFVNLSNATGGATLADAQGVGTIQNDDVISLAINNVTLSEGNSGTTAFVFTVSLSPVSAGTVTVRYATANGSGTAGSDYTTVPLTTLIFSPGQTSKTVTVNVTGNTVVEPNETFVVNLSSPTGAVLADGQGVGTILNDDGPRVRINNVSKAEGNSGSAAFTFTVSLLPASASTVTVNYATANGTATAGSDYTTTSGTLLFTAGQTSKTVTVNVIGNTTVEPNETFVVNLGLVSGAATILNGQGFGIILNDEGPVLRINDVSKVEGNSGVTAFTFTVTLPPASPSVTVNYATVNGTATAGSDYTATSGMLTFSAGQTSRTITVNVTGNTTREPNEIFAVTLSNAVGASIFDGQGVGIILNDDPVLRINDVSKAEGNSGTTALTFTVSLLPASTGPVTVRYATANGTATAGSDYTALPLTTLTFTAGQTSKLVTVNVIGDAVKEPNEILLMNLSGAIGATILDGQGVGTLLNDEGPVLRINDVSKAEGNSGTTALTFTVSLLPASTGPVTVKYATANGTATAGSDYTALPLTTLTFTAGQTSKLVTVNVTGDTVPEPNETFTVNLSEAVGATIFDARGIGTISNND